MTVERTEARRALDDVRDDLESGALPAAVVIKLAEAARRSMLAPPPVSAAERELLDEHSGASPNPTSLAMHQFHEAVGAWSSRREALTTAQVAELLGVSASRVRHLIVEGRLYALPSAGRGSPRLLPGWQFRDGRRMPGLARVLRALPPGLSPLTVADFFARAVIEEASSGTTARDWLFSGGSVEPVVELARRFDAAV